MTREEAEKRIYELRRLFKTIIQSAVMNSDDDIRGAQRGVLFTLSHLKKAGPVSPSQIAKAMSLTYPAVTHQINFLEKKGLIERQYSSSDRRVNYITLSPKGEEAVKIIKDTELERIQRVFEYLGEEDGEKFIKILGKIAGFFSQEMQSKQQVNDTSNQKEQNL